MPRTSHSMLPQTEAALHHILHHYALYTQDRISHHLPTKPLVVGVSGCQGSGKTTLCHTLVYLLAQAPYHLTALAFSLDDVYLTREEQAQQTLKDPTNPLTQFRGQPGSHDLALACRTLDSLLAVDTSQGKLPVYNKSLHHGLGDRTPESEWPVVDLPVQIILFEGWSLGFKALSDSSLVASYDTTPSLKAVPLHHLLSMNQSLRAYDALYAYFDIFVQLSPVHLQAVYRWRQEQEDQSISAHGMGLSEEQVRVFIDTYRPAYELYLPSLSAQGMYGLTDAVRGYEGLVRTDGGYSGSNRHLHLLLDDDRRVVEKSFKKEFNRPSFSSNFVGWPTSSFWVRCAVAAVVGIVSYVPIGRVGGWIIRHKRRALG
ncbi:P-loop containing nucleoside triphosphate hydrolase protein [Spinellus fusiger]|nr:P-loop containing nucleoside triphosphate hydrolase protein [Spinellus fusiger]